ncbi:TniQ family protein [Pseudomonas fluorescens]|uniref:TniQ family protein n=1 Tax=Pseudomonas fluorescens TaxID=294 RepID=UPI003D08E449
MDASNQCRWRARASPVNAVWPVVPPLLQDEVISSWLVRCALAQGCEPTTLTDEVWPGLRFWCTDPDRDLSSEQIASLSRYSGISADALQASTLLPLHRMMSGTSDFPKGIAPWFLCLGCRNRRRSGGLQYCPRCFEEQTPHYLIQDRLAWHTTCPVHHVSLLDHCECCHAPLCPQLAAPPQETLGRCHRCGYELSLARTEATCVNALSFQDATDGLFSGPPMRYGDRRLLLTEWLSISRWMIGILRSAARARSPSSERFFRDLGVSLDSFHPPATGLPFEYLAPGDRASLLANVWSILRIGPDKLVELAERECIRPSLLLPRSGELPASLAALGTVLRSKRRRNNTPTQIDNPRSPKSVLMRWHRLLRKFQR